MQATERAMLEVFGEMLVLDPNNAHVKEAFDKARAMLGRDDQGWQVFRGGNGNLDDQYGLRLDDLKQWGGKIHEAVVAAPWIGAGFRRRAHYIWQNGIRYGNIPGKGAQGKKNIQRLIDQPGNQFHFFSKTARRKREELLYAEGVAFWIGNEKTKELESIPLRQIVDTLLEPHGLGYAWAYLRKWSEYNLSTGEWVDKERWYFTDRWVKNRVANIKTKGSNDAIEVDQDHVIFDMHANATTGLVYGSPDALAAWIWNGIARDATMDGRSMQQALTTFALKATTPSKDSGQDAAIKLATTQGAGNTAITGATDLVPLSSAGKGYDFASIRFLVAIVAAALDISVIHLTANPGDAGSSYGSAQTLDLPTRLAMEARRDDHVELDTRVLVWMGVEEPEVGFVPYQSGEETYRASQALILEYAADVYTRQELRDQLDDLHGRPNGTVPEETDGPAIVKARLLAAIEAKNAAAAAKASADAAAKAADAAPKQAASPAQGQSNGTGGQSGAANDIRRD